MNAQVQHMGAAYGLFLNSEPTFLLYALWCGLGFRTTALVLIDEEEPLSITIYGIKNCDTMKKARAWLDGHGVAYDFHDYKAAGIAKERLKQWSDELGWESLLNRAGTTFRKLPDAEKEGLTEKKALSLMLEQPSMIKRPVLDLGGKVLVGFKEEIYAKEVGPRFCIPARR